MGQVIFIGPIGPLHKMAGGDSVKNYLMTQRLRTFFDDLVIHDTNLCRKSLTKTLKLVGTLLFRRKSHFIVSAASGGAYRILQVMRLLGIHDTIYWVIGGDAPRRISSGELSAWPYKNVRLFIVEGKKMAAELNNKGFTNTLVLPNFKHITYIPLKNWERSGRPRRFVFLSRVMREKGCDLIFDAMRLLGEKDLSDLFTVDFYGRISEDYEADFRQQLSCTPNAQYKGFLNLQDTAGVDVLASYDAMLFPTFYPSEGFAGVLVDAMVAGLPVIASDWSLNAETVEDGVNGIIIPPSDAHALFEAMYRLITDHATVIKMGKECQSRCLRYDTDHLLTREYLDSIGL